MTTHIPGSDVDRSGVSESTRRDLERDLRSALRGDVLFDGATRGIYATDSSNYRQVPLGVVYPLDEDDVRATARICARHDAPVLGRGAGTSLAGQACNVAVVIDMSRHMNRILAIDPVRRVARVQPGVVLDDLNRAARAIDLTFGPDPATHAWCTIGGMVGNNSCGTHALKYGKTVDNIEELRVVTYEGESLVLDALDETEEAPTVGSSERERIIRELRDLRTRYHEEIASGYPALSRRVSGFNLDQLLDDKGFHLARSVVGSESTCVLVTEITVALSQWPRFRVLVVLGYDDIYVAADDVPRLLEYQPLGLEGFDQTLIEQMRRAELHVGHLGMLPRGGGWLLCEIGADSLEEVNARAAQILEDLPGSISGIIYSDALDQHRVWQIRESGLGATARPRDQPVNYEGWEDAAVLPEHLGAYMRGIRDLWTEFHLNGAWYGHFGQGCVHTRNNFDLSSVEGLRQFRAFVERAADLCVSLGGSISGEHGDGQARGELLARMYSPRLIEAFREFKAVWDPRGRMNPGKMIDAFPLDTNLRHGPRYRSSNLLGTNFAFPHDHGSFQEAADRCVGVGKCRSDGAGVMCPSFRATRDEKHSTRGRAKLLAELFQGGVIPETWRSQEVFDALDLCLSCKGCVSDCPTHVDMATYKSEFLSHYYEGRLRPRSAYALGLLPWAGRLGALLPAFANTILQGRPWHRAVMRLAGLSPERSAPRFALRSFRRGRVAHALMVSRAPTVVLWADTFSDLFSPARLEATAAVLEHAGEQVIVPPQWACCGRTLYDSGMLARAKRTALRVLDILGPFIEEGLAIVVAEPSCLATFRDEFPHLLPDDPRADLLAARARSLGEHLDIINWSPPAASRGPVAVHPHCHQRAIGGSQSDVNVLTRAGFDVELLDVGCCGLAGSFGFEAQHDALSREIARDRFIPGIIEGASRGPVVLDGFSCDIQAAQLTNVLATNIAELLRGTFDMPPRGNSR